MKIRRFFASDIRRAMRMVREELGSDAVILSNRSVDEGIEIVAARDFDEKIVAKELQEESTPSYDRSGKLEPVEPAQAENDIKASPKLEMKAILDNLPIRDQAQRKQLPIKPEQKTGLPKPAAILSNGQPESTDSKPRVSQFGDEGNQTKPHPQFIKLNKEIQQMRRLLDSHLSETAWAQSSYKNPTRIDLLRYFSKLGFSKRLSMDLSNRFGVHDDFDSARQKGAETLSVGISLSGNDLLDCGGTVALVGPTGVGKTTTIAKLAAKFRLKHGPNQVALISIDNERIGAHEQLNTYGRILGVPVRTATNPDDLRNLLNGFLDRRLVLIDTAGMGQHDERLNRQLAFFKDLDTTLKTFLVISSASQLAVMKQVAEAFRGFQPHAHILTKLDEAASLGAAISLVVENQLPLAFETDGQRVPEDVHAADPKRLIERCFENELAEDEEMFVNPGQFAYQDWLAQGNV